MREGTQGPPLVTSLKMSFFFLKQSLYIFASCLNFASRERAPKAPMGMMCSSGGCDIQYLFNIYKRQVFLSHFRSNFFKKNLLSDFINVKNTLFKGFTRGDPWVPSLVKQNLNRTKFMKSFTA